MLLVMGLLRQWHGMTRKISYGSAPMLTPSDDGVGGFSVRRSVMRVGVPAEVKNNEFRVAITPAGVHVLVGRGHEVLV